MLSFTRIVPIGLFLLLSFSHIEAALPAARPAQTNRDGSAEEKEKIIQYDQVDPSSTLAIPFDDSEVEDEELIEWSEGKDVFPLKTLPRK